MVRELSPDHKVGVAEHAGFDLHEVNIDEWKIKTNVRHYSPSFPLTRCGAINSSGPLPQLYIEVIAPDRVIPRWAKRVSSEEVQHEQGRA